jgi:hypothetical protein
VSNNFTGEISKRLREFEEMLKRLREFEEMLKRLRDVSRKAKLCW